MPCGPDPESLRDVDIPAGPPEVANGDLADDLRLLGDRVRADNREKAGVRAELGRCLR